MISITTDGGSMTAELSGDIDHHAARELRRELDDMISRCQPEILIMDMAKVGFMDSSGVGLILVQSGHTAAISRCGMRPRR